MSSRQSVQSGAPWESTVGYARAVRVGRHVFVAGTIGREADGSLTVGNAHRQAERALEIICEALTKLGASPSDVVRTRMFVTDISRWEEFGRAHAAIFGEIRPATTMVEVTKLITADALIEIEADAVVEV